MQVHLYVSVRLREKKSQRVVWGTGSVRGTSVTPSVTEGLCVCGASNWRDQAACTPRGFVCHLVIARKHQAELLREQEAWLGEPGTEVALSLVWMCVCISVRETATGGPRRSRLTARETTRSRDWLRESTRVCVCVWQPEKRMHKPVTG